MLKLTVAQKREWIEALKKTEAKKWEYLAKGMVPESYDCAACGLAIGCSRCVLDDVNGCCDGLYNAWRAAPDKDRSRAAKKVLAYIRATRRALERSLKTAKKRGKR